MKKIISLSICLILLLTGCKSALANNKINKITVNGAIVRFQQGQDFSTEGMTVTATYEDGSTALVDADSYFVDLSKVDMDKTGVYSVFVRSKNSDVQTSYKIRVVPRAVLTDKFHILSIGNSFSEDSLAYLYQIAESMGQTDIVIGHATIGGSSLAIHAGNAYIDRADYTYVKWDKSSIPETLSSVRLEKALTDYPWQAVVIQQSSVFSGIPDSYNEDLDFLISYIKTKTSPDIKIIWHMTWAYAQDYNSAAFDNYERDQLNMYISIVSAVKEKIQPRLDIEGIIPTGTVIQNIRTSIVGDTLNRDGTHLSIAFGRYIAGLTWYATLSGQSIENIEYLPEGIDEDYMIIVNECIENALSSLFILTPSKYQ